MIEQGFGCFGRVSGGVGLGGVVCGLLGIMYLCKLGYELFDDLM